MRVTGAQYLARIGVELHKIQLLGRWDSDIILRYVREAPLAAITQDVRALVSAGSCANALDVQGLEEIKQELRNEVGHVFEAWASEQALAAAARAAVPTPAPEPRHAVVRNPATRMLPRALKDRMATPPAMWHTTYGWRFGLVVYDEFESAPPGAKCRRCFGVDVSA